LLQIRDRPELKLGVDGCCGQVGCSRRKTRTHVVGLPYGPGAADHRIELSLHEPVGVDRVGATAVVKSDRQAWNLEPRCVVSFQA
jgi:hypothetical protein